MGKKAAKNKLGEERQYSVGNLILGKVRGYPLWPGIVVDPAGVPQGVMDKRPLRTKSIYHCTLFFPTGEYAWLHPKHMSILKQNKIKDFIAKTRNNDLREGYRVARKPNDWLTGFYETRRQTPAEEDLDQVDQPEHTISSKGSKKHERHSPSLDTETIL